MSYTDANISGSRVRLRRSFTAGVAPASGELRPGEAAVNASDGALYVGKADGSAGVVPGASGITNIVKLTQAQYDAITATASSTTLYVITPNP